MATKTKANAFTYLMLFSGMALFGSATPLSKLVTKHFPVFIAGGLRVLLAFFVLLPFIRLRNIRNYQGADLWLLFGISALGVFGFTACMLYGMRMVSGVTGSAVMSITPAITAILSVVIFKDQLTWKKGLALVLAFSGVLLLQLKQENMPHHTAHSWLGVALIFIAVCCEAGYTLMGKALTGKYAPEEVSGLSALIAVICFIPACIWQAPEVHLEKIKVVDWGWLAAYGLVTMGLGSILWYRGISKVEGSVAASFMGVMPVSALLLSYLLLDEEFRWVQLAGFLLVFGGVILMISVHREMEKGN